jgi:hypothetical protein
MRKLFFVLSCCFFSAHWVSAQGEPRFYAEVDHSEIALGQTVRVSFILENGKGNSRITPPDWSSAGLTVVGSSQSSSMSIMNGETRSTASYNYTVAPADTGIVTIPAASVKSGSTELRTEPIVIKVRPGADGLSPVQPQRSPYQPSSEPKKKIKTIKM